MNVSCEFWLVFMRIRIRVLKILIEKENSGKKRKKRKKRKEQRKHETIVPIMKPWLQSNCSDYHLNPSKKDSGIRVNKLRKRGKYC